MTKAKAEQEDLFKAETSWFHVFKDMIDNGDMARLDGSAIKVYLVVKSYTNFATGHAFPAVELVGEKAGLSRPQVMRCLKSLEDAGYITRGKSGRKNLYTLREKVMINDADGRPQAVATWDYIPNNVKTAMAELRHAVISGEMLDGKIIHIENLFLNMNIANGDSTQVNFNNTPGFDKLSPDMQEKLLALRHSINKE
jgi:DNA-binding transcriptional ArsR family regulator